MLRPSLFVIPYHRGGAPQRENLDKTKKKQSPSVSPSGRERSSPPGDGSLKSTLKAIFAIGRDYQSETGLLDDRRLIERSSEIPKVIESIILLRIVYLYLPLPPFAINSEGNPRLFPAGDFPSVFNLYLIISLPGVLLDQGNQSPLNRFDKFELIVRLGVFSFPFLEFPQPLSEIPLCLLL